MSNTDQKVSKCIYCQQWKPFSSFNREHVIPRMMGTYDGSGFVLGNNEVCQECNSYFSKEIENVVGLDSIEAFFRAQFGTKKISDGHLIGSNRLTLEGKEGIYKGLKFNIYSDNQFLERIHLDILPAIGIVLNDKEQEYEYYDLDNLPHVTDDILNRIKNAKMPFIMFGYEKEEVVKALANKGYPTTGFVFDIPGSIQNLSTLTSLDVLIKGRVEKVLLQLAAKTVFNHMCKTYGKDWVCHPIYNNFRNFIKNGRFSQPIPITISNGGLFNIPQNVKLAHTVGTLWTSINHKIYLCGFVSWFNKITYTFAIRPWITENVNVLPNNKITIFDNVARSSTTVESLCYIDWPRNENQLQPPPDYDL